MPHGRSTTVTDRPKLPDGGRLLNAPAPIQRIDQLPPLRLILSKFHGFTVGEAERQNEGVIRVGIAVVERCSRQFGESQPMLAPIRRYDLNAVRDDNISGRPRAQAAKKGLVHPINETRYDHSSLVMSS